ncbi:hypothetical protein C8Q76DRAFT_795703 [Earliella scabrosa]|nr:hypothetical protein C8Q76DRAFT_795703 [Earliella scabrosa]
MSDRESSASSDASEHTVHTRSRTTKLTKGEQALDIPDVLRVRVEGGVYTWKMFLADYPAPDIKLGRMGDVWITTTEDKAGRIYIKGEGNRWYKWRRKNKYRKKTTKDPAKFKYSFHPWLRNRRLEYNGNSAIGWYLPRAHTQHQSTWAQKRADFNKTTSYHKLEVSWIARHIATSVPSFSGDADTDEPESNASQSSSADSEQSSESSEHASVTEESVSDDPLPAHPPIKRERSESPAAPVRAKRAREEGVSPIPSLPLATQSHAPRASSALPAQRTVVAFLDGLPMSLSRHTHLLTTLGITDMGYIDSLSHMPKRSVDEIVALLQERGFSFMEALVLRNALGDRRRASSLHPEHGEPRVEPTSMETFLARLRPSMAHHVHIFDELGVDLTHIPVLAQLGDESYAEFERALGAKGLTWIDAYIVKVGIQEYAHARQEPLLAAA